MVNIYSVQFINFKKSGIICLVARDTSDAIPDALKLHTKF